MIMKEEWIKWRKVNSTLKNFEISNIELNNDGLIINIDNLEINYKIIFESIYSFRQCNESERWRTISSVQFDKGNFFSDCLFYEIKNSNYSKWIEEETFATVKAEEIFHFCIVTANDVVDILAYDEPQILVTYCDNNLDIKTDMRPIEKYFDIIKNAKSVYWLANYNGYNMFYDIELSDIDFKGFIVLDDENYNLILKSYEWCKADVNFIKGFEPNITGLSNFDWYYSKEFSSDMSQNKFIGNVYVDTINKILYFIYQTW